MSAITSASRDFPVPAVGALKACRGMLSKLTLLTADNNADNATERSFPLAKGKPDKKPFK